MTILRSIHSYEKTVLISYNIITALFLFAVASTLNAWSHHTVHHTCYNNKRYGLGLARTLCGTECVTTLVTTHTAAVAA